MRSGDLGLSSIGCVASIGTRLNRGMGEIPRAAEDRERREGEKESKIHALCSCRSLHHGWGCNVDAYFAALMGGVLSSCLIRASVVF